MTPTNFMGLESLRIRSESGESVSVPEWLLLAAAEGIWYIQADLRTGLINDAMAGLLGESAVAVAGVHVRPWFGQSGCETLQRLMFDACAGADGKNVVSPERRLAIVHQDGTEVSGLLRLFPLTNSLGQASGILAVTSAVGRDARSGLHNRAYFEERLGSEVSRALRYRRRFSLLLVRLEALDTVCRTFGAKVAEEALREVGSTLRSGSGGEAGLVRVSDELAHYDERTFAVIATETGLEGAMTLAGRILARLSNHVWKARGAVELANSARIGLACCPLHGKEATLLSSAANSSILRADSGIGVPESLAQAGAVLIVEGDERARETWCAALEQRGFATTTVPDERAAWSELRAGKTTPDVLMISAPEQMDKEALAELCVGAKLARIEVILLSGLPRRMTSSERAALRNPHVINRSTDPARLSAIVADVRQGKEPIRQEDVPAVLRTAG